MITYADFGSNRPGGGHWHVVPSGHRADVTAYGIEADHEAWHDSDAPCMICGALSFTAGGHHLTPSGLPLSPCYRAEVAS